jgi:hypothetical protein
MSVITAPTPQQLSIYSQVVYRNTPYKKENEELTKGEKGNPIPMKLGDPSPIKYVFYFIKEKQNV